MRRAYVLVFCVLAFAACTNARVDSIDLTRTKLLVVALGTNTSHRVRFEDELVAKLDAGGVVAAASHARLPTFDGATRDDVVRLARAQDATAVVVVAAMAVDATTGLEPLGPTPEDAGGRLGAFIDDAMARGDIADGHVVFVTRVYRLATDALVWGGVSWVVAARDVDVVIDETTSVIAENILTARREL